jgi:hypothetical protein
VLTIDLEVNPEIVLQHFPKFSPDIEELGRLEKVTVNTVEALFKRLHPLVMGCVFIGIGASIMTLSSTAIDELVWGHIAFGVGITCVGITIFCAIREVRKTNNERNTKLQALPPFALSQTFSMLEETEKYGAFLKALSDQELVAIFDSLLDCCETPTKETYSENLIHLTQIFCDPFFFEKMGQEKKERFLSVLPQVFKEFPKELGEILQRRQYMPDRIQKIFFDLIITFRGEDCIEFFTALGTAKSRLEKNPGSVAPSNKETFPDQLLRDYWRAMIHGILFPQAFTTGLFRSSGGISKNAELIDAELKAFFTACDPKDLATTRGKDKLVKLEPLFNKFRVLMKDTPSLVEQLNTALHRNKDYRGLTESAKESAETTKTPLSSLFEADV